MIKEFYITKKIRIAKRKIKLFCLRRFFIYNLTHFSYLKSLSAVKTRVFFEEKIEWGIKNKRFIHFGA